MKVWCSGYLRIFTRVDSKDISGLWLWWEDQPWSRAQEPRPRVLYLCRPPVSNWKWVFNLLIWIEAPWHIRSQSSPIYVGPIPLILWLGLWCVSLGIKPSSQLEAISQCLHASDHSPIAQIHCVIDFTGMCLRCHSFAEHKCLVWCHKNQQSDYVFREHMSSLENSGMWNRKGYVPVTQK